jgi:hypothetical protein
LFAKVFAKVCFFSFVAKMAESKASSALQYHTVTYKLPKLEVGMIIIERSKTFGSSVDRRVLKVDNTDINCPRVFVELTGFHPEQLQIVDGRWRLPHQKCDVSLHLRLLSEHNL